MGIFINEVNCMRLALAVTYLDSIFYRAFRVHEFSLDSAVRRLELLILGVLWFS